MRYWILHWILSGVALFLVARILPGIEVDSLGAALIAALVIGLVSATVGVILKILLLPFILLTLGSHYILAVGGLGVRRLAGGSPNSGRYWLGKNKSLPTRWRTALLCRAGQDGRAGAD